MQTSTIIDAGPEESAKGVTAQRLSIAGHRGRRVPGLILTPEGAQGPRPVVMLGHGAGGSKDEAQMLQIARWLVRREGFAVAIIDGPVHGERRPPGVEQVGPHALQVLADPSNEAMAADWRATIDACGELPNAGNERPAYLGFSMGTMLGVPAVASEPRFRCAVFAIGGIMQEGPNLLRDAASTISIPVLMINQSEDEIFSRESTFRLYDVLPGPKRVFFYPGGHTGVPREAMERVREFLHAQLVDASDESGAPRGAW